MHVIDGDGHFLEPVSLWDDYVPTAMKDRIHMVRGEDGFAEKLIVGDLELPHSLPPMYPMGIGDALTPGGLKKGRAKHRRYEEAEPAGWDARKRLEMHDSEDIVASVLFSTRGLESGAITDPEIAVAFSQAVNNWAADYASVAPDELHIVATLPDHFPELAAKELRRCVEEHGFVAGAVRPNPTVDGRLLDHPDYEILWSTAEDLEIPICCHNAADYNRPQTGKDRMKNFLTMHAAVHPLEAIVAFPTLYQGGVFDRHPKLRMGFMEATCGWVPFWLERLHEHWEVVGWLVDAERDPREVFIEHCVVGCEGEEEMVPYVQQRFGNDMVLWASDFPHFDTEAPFTADMLERTDMTDDQMAGVMRNAAIKFYKLDYDRIVKSNAQRRGIAAAPSA